MFSESSLSCLKDNPDNWEEPRLFFETFGYLSAETRIFFAWTASKSVSVFCFTEFIIGTKVWAQEWVEIQFVRRGWISLCLPFSLNRFSMVKPAGIALGILEVLKILHDVNVVIQVAGESFDKSCPMLSVSWRSMIEGGGEVQVS